MADFEKAVSKVINLEGGYTNHPKDRGGPTNFGIREDLAIAAGYNKPIQEWTKEEAKQYYKKTEWDGLRLDEIEDQDIALELFDTAVNMGKGSGRPIKWLQEALNALNKEGSKWPDIEEDGKIGPTTIRMINAALTFSDMKECILKLLNADQAVRYKKITAAREANEAFIKGWLLNRVAMPPER